MKYYGKIGFTETVETRQYKWEEQIVERYYAGDVLRNVNQQRDSQYLNDDISISNSISIICDPYAYENFNRIKYCTWMNSKWKVTSVEVNYPRLTLTLGGIYHEQPSGE